MSPAHIHTGRERRRERDACQGVALYVGHCMHCCTQNSVICVHCFACTEQILCSVKDGNWSTEPSDIVARAIKTGIITTANILNKHKIETGSKKNTRRSRQQKIKSEDMYDIQKKAATM